jgi:hypothetical protein
MRRITVFCAAFLLASAANASTVIYSSFGPGDTYDMTSGWAIGDTPVYVQGLQFTPAVNAVVQTIEIAAFRLAGGAAVNVSLYTDVGNQPGVVIETLPICCFGFTSHIQLVHSVLRPLLTGGAKYWLVVSPIAVGDYFGWSRNLNPPFEPNVQRSMGGPWIVGDSYRGTLRISTAAPTPVRVSSWGRVKSLYR